MSLFCCIGNADEGRRPPRPANNPQNGRTNASAPPRRSKLPSNAQLNQTLRPPIHRDPLSQTGEYLSLIPPSASPQTTPSCSPNLQNQSRTTMRKASFICSGWHPSPSPPNPHPKRRPLSCHPPLDREDKEVVELPTCSIPSRLLPPTPRIRKQSCSKSDAQPMCNGDWTSGRDNVDITSL